MNKHPVPEGAKAVNWSPRERAEAICNNMFTGHATLYVDEITEEIQKAVKAEREACAELTEAECERVLSKQDGHDDSVDLNLRMVAVLLPDLAAKIRARGTPQ
jgi:hypothetical protein